MDVQRPVELLKPLHVPNRLLLGPGPATCSPRVLNAVHLPTMGLFKPELSKLLKDIKDGIRYLFQTKNELSIVLTAAGNGGMEAVFLNLTEPGDKVVIAVNGFWAERAVLIAQRFDLEIITLSSPAGDNFGFDVLEEAVQKYQPKLLYIVQGETSTGVIQPLDGLGKICHRYNSLLVVDAVPSAGAVPLFMDRWEIDVVFAGSQKVLSCPPGLCPISFSPRAEQVIKNRRTPLRGFYLDVTLLGQQWECYNVKWAYHHTISSNALCGLRESLAMLAEEGIENSIKRHKECSDHFRKGLKEIGLKLFVKDDEKVLPTIATVELPSDVDGQDIIQYILKNYQMEISPGLAALGNKILRIGFMGYNATVKNAELMLKVLEEAVKFARYNNKKFINQF